ncbi:hypothetical protein D0S45_07985 [Marinifilum sp. JC120]|nr:hypothetical protein D0S45_07985 [Marinifilum sp. JC120]
MKRLLCKLKKPPAAGEGELLKKFPFPRPHPLKTFQYASQFRLKNYAAKKQFRTSPLNIFLLQIFKL